MGKTLKDLIKATEELNEVLGLSPEIPTTGIKEPKLLEKVKEAAELVDLENDEISVVTLQTLRDFDIEIEGMDKILKPAKKEAPVKEEKKGKKAPVKEEVSEEDDVDVDEDTDDDDDEEEEQPETKKSAKKPTKEGKPAKKEGEKKAKPSPKNAEKTKLGHIIGSKGAAIDGVFLSAKKALSMEEIAEKSGCDVARVKSHIKHLKENFKFEEKDGKFLIKL